MKKRRKTPAAEMLGELGSEVRIFDQRDIIRMLKLQIEREGDQGTFARNHGLDRSHVNQIVNRKRPISRAILKTLGLQKVYTAE